MEEGREIMNTFESNDEYLEHLFGLGHKKERKNHKYIAKIDTPKGVRYFYTYADLKAYYANQRVKDKLGFDERERRNAAWLAYEQASQERNKAAKDYSNIRTLGNSSSEEKHYKDMLNQARDNEESARQVLEKSENEYSATALGKFDNLIQAVIKFGKKKLSHISLDGVKKVSELYKNASNAYRSVVTAIENFGVAEYPVTKSIIPRSEKSIIERLAGGDMTSGSCVSLAMAYAGNKAGYDVIDYRGGYSQRCFSVTDNVKNIAMMSDVNSRIIDYDGFKTTSLSSAKELLQDVQNSENFKEFLLTAGCHCAVVRRTGSTIEYLEMQAGANSSYRNGWHTLDDNILIERFGIPSSTLSNVLHSGSSMLIDVKSLGQSEEFLSLLSYVNTPESKQQKWSGGDVK